jgi:hypothetical protein
MLITFTSGTLAPAGGYFGADFGADEIDKN